MLWVSLLLFTQLHLHKMHFSFLLPSLPFQWPGRRRVWWNYSPGKLHAYLAEVSFSCLSLSLHYLFTSCPSSERTVNLYPFLVSFKLL